MQSPALQSAIDASQLLITGGAVVRVVCRLGVCSAGQVRLNLVLGHTCSEQELLALDRKLDVWRANQKRLSARLHEPKTRSVGQYSDMGLQLMDLPPRWAGAARTRSVKQRHEATARTDSGERHISFSTFVNVIIFVTPNRLQKSKHREDRFPLCFSVSLDLVHTNAL